MKFFAPSVDAPVVGFHQGYGHGQCFGVVRRCGSGFHHSEFQIAECAVESHVDGWCGCRDLVEIDPDGCPGRIFIKPRIETNHDFSLGYITIIGGYNYLIGI